MQNNNSLVDTLLYFEIFGFIPNFEELYTFYIGEKISKNELRNEIKLNKFIDSKNGYFFLKGNRVLCRQREIRSTISQEKRKLADAQVKILAKIPTIQSIALSGSVACDNAREEDDIDLFIVTAPHSVWITRLLVYVLLRTTRKIRGKKNKNNLFCPNMFVSIDHSKIEEKNLYNASEIAHLVPLYDKNNSFTHFLTSNNWIEEYFPQFPLGKGRTSEALNTNKYLKTLNMLLYRAQTLPMKKKITNEKISEDRIQFHPNNLSFPILKLWIARRNAFYQADQSRKITHPRGIAGQHNLTPGS